MVWAVSCLSGVTDKGQIVGQQMSAHTLEEVANEIRRIEPPIFPGIETVELKDGNAVIALRSDWRRRSIHVRRTCPTSATARRPA